MPSYPLTAPASPAPSSISMRLRRATAVSQSPFSFSQQVYDFLGAMWEAEVTLPPMTRAEASAWIAFLVNLHGRRGTFVFGDPTIAAQGTASAGHIASAASVRDTSISVKNMGNGGTLLAGDYVQIGSGADTNLYMVGEAFTADASGNGTLVIEPGLRRGYAVDTPLVLSAPKGIWRMGSDDQGWSIDTATIYGMTFSCFEAL